MRDDGGCACGGGRLCENDAIALRRGARGAIGDGVPAVEPQFESKEESMKPVLAALCGLSLMLSSAAGLAQHAHEHGVAELRVAADADELAIEFASPLESLVGFEHEPRTEAQRAALVAAEARLRDFGSLFSLPAAAGCTLRGVALDSPWLQGAGHQRAHDAAHPHARAHEDGHAELVAGYSLRCEAPAALDALGLKLFEAFPRLREIRAERVSAHGRGAATLRPQAPALRLR